MTGRVISAGPDASFREMLHLMISYDVNRLPIVESNRVIGIVTRADLLRTLARPDAAVTEDAQWRLLHDLWIDPSAADRDHTEGHRHDHRRSRARAPKRSS